LDVIMGDHEDRSYDVMAVLITLDTRYHIALNKVQVVRILLGLP